MKKLTPKEQMEHIRNGCYYRGVVIHTFTTLERTMEQILTDYYITNEGKKNNFVTIILDRMTFESKRTSLKSLNDKFCEYTGFVKTKNNSYPNSKLFEEIRLLQDLRNNFAHFTIIIPYEETDNVIGLANLRDGVDMKWYNDADIAKINGRIMKVTTDLSTIFSDFTGALLADN